MTHVYLVVRMVRGPAGHGEQGHEYAAIVKDFPAFTDLEEAKEAVAQRNTYGLRLARLEVQ